MVEINKFLKENHNEDDKSFALDVAIQKFLKSKKLDKAPPDMEKNPQQKSKVKPYEHPKDPNMVEPKMLDVIKTTKSLIPDSVREGINSCIITILETIDNKDLPDSIIKLYSFLRENDYPMGKSFLMVHNTLVSIRDIPNTAVSEIFNKELDKWTVFSEVRRIKK